MTITNLEKTIRDERARNELGILLDKQQHVENELLKRKILKEGRIDLLCTEVLGYSLWDFHKTIMKFQNNRDMSLVLAPRDSGKSVILNYTRAIYEILLNPNIRIGLCSKTGLQAEAFLKEIRNHLESNPRLIELFGKQVGDIWHSRELTVAGKTEKHKESTITCIGFGTALVGKHFDMLIGDDLVDEESSRTELQRERQRTWFYQSLYPTLEPNPKIYLLGTRYHYLDLWGHFIGDTEFEGSGQFKDCFLRVKALDDSDEDNLKSFWVEKFPVKALLEKRKNMGIIIFNAQMQNDTQAMKGKIFKEKYFRYYTKLPEGLRVSSGYDLAVGDDSTKGDKFAQVTIGIGEEGDIYVQSYFERRGVRPTQQWDYVCHKAREEEPLAIGIESNAYQAVAAIMVGEMDKTLNVKGIPTLKDKKSNGWRVAALFEAGKIHVGVHMQKFISHFLLFTGEHKGDDDLFDAFFKALEVSIWKRRKKDRKEPGLIGFKRR